MGERIGVRRLVWVAGLLLAACSAEGGELVANDDTPGSDGRPGPAGSPAPGADADTGGSSGPAGSDGSLPGAPAAPAPAKKGDLLVTVEADRGAASDAVVSLGVPFPPGTLTDGNLVTLLDPAGREVSTQRTVLATWPADKSVRSVLVVFRATLAAGAKATYTLRYGEAPKEPALSGLAANPDGPVAAMLPPAWYGASLVSGRLSPAQDNTRFAAFDRDLDARVGAMSPTYESYGVNCPTTSNHRTYYDGTHGLYTRFLRHGGAARLRRARAEATWYRQNELRWNAGRTLAWQVCQGETWTPTTMLGWGVLRRMTSQGMLDDYLITGDPAARAAVVGMGEAFRQNLPALTARAIPDLEVTERNMAWPLMGLAAYYAVDARPEVLAAAKSVADRAIAWQARGTSGAFEHDINRPDPSECEDGPAGASPFMTSLLIDALVDYHSLSKDARVVTVLRKAAAWFEKDARSSDGLAFRYLWNCKTDSYDNTDYVDLNLLIVHVFGATYALTGETKWLDLGDTMADAGVEAMYVGRPKQWNQAARAFPRYLGYRALGRKP